MASKYGIITIADLEGITGTDYSTLVDEDDARLYNDTVIEAQITASEELVSAIARKETYDSVNASDIIIWSVKTLSKIYMDNMLIADGIIQGERIDPIFYYISIIKPMIESNETSKNNIKSYKGIDDYNF